MRTFEETLAAVAAAPRKTTDVPVIFDEVVSAERARLESELENADDEARLGAQSVADVVREQLTRLEDSVEDARVFLRFKRLPTRAWMELTSLHPVRLGSEIDRYYGFNWDAVCEAAARYRDPLTGEAFGYRVEGGEPVEVSEEQWSVIYDRLPGGEAAAIRDAIWELNAFGPEQKRDALGKTFGATSRSVTK